MTPVTPLYQFATEKVLGERSGVRLMEGASNFLANIVKVNDISVLSDYIPNLSPIQKEFKALDGAFYVNNFCKGVTKPFTRFVALYHAVYHDFFDGDRVGHEESGEVFGHFLYDLNKTIGDGAAAAKFMGRFVPMLAPHGWVFGLFKNVCTLMRLVVDGKHAYSQLGVKQQQPSSSYAWWATAALVGTYVFSILLNGFGALEALFGENMPANHRMPPITWITWGVLATLCNIAETRLREYERCSRVQPPSP